MADLTFRSASTGVDSSFAAATISATLPTGTAQGDGMVVVYDSAFLAGAGAPTHTTPSGWTVPTGGTATYNNGTLEGRKTFYGRVAGASEGAVTLTSNANAAHVYSRLSCENPDPTTFVSSVTPLFGLLASTSSPVFPSITTNGDRQLVLYQIAATLVGGITFTPASSGLTERADANSSSVYELQATTIAAQGTKTISSSSADQFFYGIAVFNPAHQATGALAAASAAIAGTATHLTLHTATGALAAQAATIAGVAAHHHAATGALAAAATTVAGTAAHLTLHTSTGALSAAASAIAGAAAHQHASTGAVAAAAATISGSAEHTAPGAHAATGSLQAGNATIAGVAEVVSAQPRRSGPRRDRLYRTYEGRPTETHTSRGALVAGAGTMAGHAHRIPAAAKAPARAIVVHESSGALLAGEASMAGAALRYYRRVGLYRQAAPLEVLSSKDARLNERIARLEAEVAAMRQSTGKTS